MCASGLLCTTLITSEGDLNSSNAKKFVDFDENYGYELAMYMRVHKKATVVRGKELQRIRPAHKGKQRNSQLLSMHAFLRKR